jgi:sulfite exporter TauE/SafE
MPAGPGKLGRFITGRLVYNAGRVMTYTILGMIVGYLGEKILFPAMQQRISIVAGVIILAGVVLPKIAG